MSNILEATQLVNGRTRIQTQAAWLQTVPKRARLAGDALWDKTVL